VHRSSEEALNVLVLTRPNCQPCRGTKRLLAAHGIEYDEIDITTDEDKRAWAMELGHMQAPVVIITNQYAEVTDHWSGIRPDRLARYA
jgi:glutaredoxin-like protein NrdH